MNGNELLIASNGELPIITPIEKELLASSLSKNLPNYNIKIPKRSIFFIVLPENKAKSCSLNARINSVSQMLGNKNGNNKISGKTLGKLVDLKSTLKPKDHIQYNQEEDFEWTLPQLTTGKIKSNKDRFDPTTERDVKTKYVTFSDNDWLSKFPEKVHKNTLFDDEFSKNSVLDMNSYNRYRRHDYSHHADDEELNVDESISDGEMDFEMLPKLDIDPHEEVEGLKNSNDAESIMIDAFDNNGEKRTSEEAGSNEFLKTAINEKSKANDDPIEKTNINTDINGNMKLFPNLQHVNKEKGNGTEIENDPTVEKSETNRIPKAEVLNDDSKQKTSSDNLTEENHFKTEFLQTEINTSADNEKNTDGRENYQDVLYSEDSNKGSRFVSEVKIEGQENLDDSNIENSSTKEDTLRDIVNDEESKDVKESIFQEDDLSKFGGEESYTKIPVSEEWTEDLLANNTSLTHKNIDQMILNLDHQTIQDLSNGSEKESKLNTSDEKISIINSKDESRNVEKGKNQLNTTRDNNRESTKTKDKYVTETNIANLTTKDSESSTVKNDVSDQLTAKVHIKTNIMKVQNSKKSKRDVISQTDDLDVNSKEENKNDTKVHGDVNKVKKRKSASVIDNEKLVFVPQITMFDSSFHKIGVLDNGKEGKHEKFQISSKITEKFLDESKNRTVIPKTNSTLEILEGITPENKSERSRDDNENSRNSNSLTGYSSTLDNFEAKNIKAGHITEEQANSLHKVDDFTSAEEKEVIDRVTENRKRSPNFNTYFEFSEPFLMPATKGIKALVNYPSYKNIIHHAMSYYPHKESSKDTSNGSKPAVISFLPKHVSHNNHVHYTLTTPAAIPRVGKEDVTVKPNITNETVKMPTISKDVLDSNNTKRQDTKPAVENNSHGVQTTTNNNTKNVELGANLTLINDTGRESDPLKAEMDVSDGIILNMTLNNTKSNNETQQNFNNTVNSTQEEKDHVNNSTVSEENQILNLNLSTNADGVKYNFKRNSGTFKNDYEIMISQIIKENKNQDQVNFGEENRLERKKNTNWMNSKDEKYSSKDNADYERSGIIDPKFKGADLFTGKSTNLNRKNTARRIKENGPEDSDADVDSDNFQFDVNSINKIIPYETEDNTNEDNEESKKTNDLKMKMNDQNDVQSNYMKYDHPKYNRLKWNKKNWLNNEESEEGNEETNEDEIREAEDKNDDSKYEEEGSAFFKALLKFKNVNVSNDEDKMNNKENVTERKENIAETNNTSVSHVSNIPGKIGSNETEEDNKSKSSLLLGTKSSDALENKSKHNVKEKVQSKRIMRNINNENYNMGFDSNNKYYKLNKDKEYVQLFPYSYNSTHNQLLDFNSNKQNENLLIPKTQVPNYDIPSFNAEELINSQKINSYPLINERFSTSTATTEAPITESTEKIPKMNIGIQSTIAQIESVQDEINYHDEKKSGNTTKPYKWHISDEKTNTGSKIPFISSHDSTTVKVSNNIEPDFFTHGHRSDTPILYDFFSRQETKENASPLVYPNVIPKENNASDLEITKSYTSVSNSNKKEPIKVSQNNVLFQPTPVIENTYGYLNNFKTMESKLDTKKSLKKQREPIKKPVKVTKTEEDLKDVDVIAEMQKAIFPDGVNQDKKDKKPVKKVKRIQERIKDLKLKREKMKSLKTKKEIDDLDINDRSEKSINRDQDESLKNKDTITTKKTKPSKGKHVAPSDTVKPLETKDYEYLANEEEIIKQSHKKNAIKDAIPIELLRLDHELELQEVKRNNRGILSNVVTKPETENALKVADKILGGVQTFMQQLDPLAGVQDHQNHLKEEKKKSIYKPKYKPLKKKAKQAFLKKNKLKQIKKKTIIPRSSSTKLPEITTRNFKPTSIFSKSKRNIYGYKNRFAKKRSVMKRDLVAVENTGAKSNAVNITEDKNEQLLNEFYNLHNGEKEIRRFSRQIPSDFLPLEAYSAGSDVHDTTNIEEFINSNSKSNFQHEETKETNNNNVNAFHERLQNYKNKQAIQRNKIDSQKWNTEESSRASLNRFNVNKNTYNNDLIGVDKENIFKDKIGGFTSDEITDKGDLNKNTSFDKGTDDSTFNDAYEESLYNLVSENNVVDELISLVYPANINTEYEGQADSDIMKNLLKEDSKIKNIYRELNYVQDIKEKNYNLLPNRYKRDSFKIDTFPIKIEVQKLKDVRGNDFQFYKKYITYIKKNLSILNSLFQGILNNNYNASKRVSLYNAHTKKEETFPEENNMDWSKIILQKRRQQTNELKNDEKKLKQNEIVTKINDEPYEIKLINSEEFNPENKNDLTLYKSMDTLTGEELTSDVNSFPEEYRHKRSIKMNENEIDDVDNELVKTNELKQINSQQNFKIPVKDKIKYIIGPTIDNFLKANLSADDVAEKIKDLNISQNTLFTNAKDSMQRNHVIPQTPSNGPRTFKYNISPNNTTVETSIKTDSIELKKPNPLIANFNQKPTLYHLTYKKPVPGKIESPRVKVYKYIGNNITKKLESNDFEPVRKYKIYLKNFNRYKRAKRMINDDNTSIHLKVLENRDQNNLRNPVNTPDYSLITNLINNRPKSAPRTTDEKSSTRRMTTDLIYDDARHMIPRGKYYEDIISNEIDKAKRKMVYEGRKKEEFDTLNKKINNEVDLLEYLELQKSMKSKLNKNTTEKHDNNKKSESDALLMKDKHDYIQKYQKLFNQIIETGDTLPRAAGVKNLNNQIEVFNEPLSKEEIKGIRIREEAEQRMIFDDDFQKALVQNAPLESTDQSDVIDEQNIINTIIINPVNKFLSYFENVRSFPNITTTNDTKELLDHSNSSSSEGNHSKISENTLLFSKNMFQETPMNNRNNYEENNSDSYKKSTVTKKIINENYDNVISNSDNKTKTIDKNELIEKNLQSNKVNDQHHSKLMYTVVGPMRGILVVLKNVFNRIENIFS